MLALSTSGTHWVVVGLGATGVSCVRHLRARGESVSVVDSREAPPGLDRIAREYPEVSVRLGGFRDVDLDRADRIVVSPGVSMREPALQRQIGRGVPVDGDIELFARIARAPVVAITGSNGKSTVTSMVATMAAEAGLKARSGGNLSPPALDLLGTSEPDLYVLELSSFQLETTRSLRPAAAVVLNVSADHMDRHRDFAEYAGIKRRIYAHASVAIVNRDDDQVVAMHSSRRPTMGFTTGEPAPGDYGLRRCRGHNWLCRGTTSVMPASSLKVPGLHNAANALAALALGEAVGLPTEAMVAGLEKFTGLPHRCELVAEHLGTRWYNDSKGTNVGATVAAIEGISGDRPVILIAGGEGKGADFGPLGAVVREKVSGAVLFGRDADRIADAIGEPTRVQRASGLPDAVRRALAIARAGDAVLFSPACASFDQFTDYRARGEAFVAVLDEVIGH